MTTSLTFLCAARKRTAQEMEQYLFQTMAGGGYLCYENEFGIDHRIADWWTRLNHIFNQARPHMKVRRMLPNRGGVVWQDGTIRTIWTFADYGMEVAAKDQVEKLEGQKTCAVAGGGKIRLPAWGVHRVCG